MKVACIHVGEESQGQDDGGEIGINEHRQKNEG